MKSLAKKLVNKLKKKKLKISIAESCTGGMLSSNITSISGSSKVFTLGLVTYSNKSKINLLKINTKLIQKYGAVSKEVCLCMAKNLNKITKTNISLAITGIAGPNGGSRNKPVGLVYIGLKKKNLIIGRKFIFKNNGRAYIQKSAVNKSLKLILSFLK